MIRASMSTRCSAYSVKKYTTALPNKNILELRKVLRIINLKYGEICGEGYLEFSVNEIIHACLRDKVDIEDIRLEFKKYNVSW